MVGRPLRAPGGKNHHRNQCPNYAPCCRLRYDAGMPDRAGSLVEQVVSHCKKMRFTGVLRIYAREGDGELIFLSGIRDQVRFGVSTGDEALERLAASQKLGSWQCRFFRPSLQAKKGAHRYPPRVRWATCVP